MDRSSFVALVNWSQPVLSSSACRLWYVSPSRVHIPFHISPLVVLLPIAVMFHNSSILTDPYAWTFRKDTCHVMWTPGRVRSICFFIRLKNGQIISAHQRTALYYLYLGHCVRMSAGFSLTIWAEFGVLVGKFDWNLENCGTLCEGSEMLTEWKS